MICPKCGAEQVEERSECIRCGVIFAKLKPEDFDQSYRLSSTSDTPAKPVKKTNLPILLIVIVVISLFIGLGYFKHEKSGQKKLDNIEIVAEQPLQEHTNAPAMQLPGFEIQPLARYEIRAKVLSIKHYKYGRWAKLSPMDLALGWGPMSDNTIIRQLDISQDNRWYFYRWKDAPPIDPALIVRNSANTHIVPADDNIKSSLLKVRRGEIVRLKGYLINVRDSEGGSWSSSLTREDSGDHSCELMLVAEATVE
ncbi:MAG: hypothetical protein ABFD50_23315 [Smithella sp.]